MNEKKQRAAITATPVLKLECKGTNYSCDNNTNSPEKKLKREEKFSGGFSSEKMSENPKEKETVRNRIKRQVRTLFLQGGKYTASTLNELVGFNDARKVISVLRSEGMMITDVRLPDQRKLYWLLNERKGGVK